MAAISTPTGEGAIALVRISGDEAIAVADAIFRGNEKPSRVSFAHASAWARSSKAID